MIPLQMDSLLTHPGSAILVHMNPTVILLLWAGWNNFFFIIIIFYDSTARVVII